MSHTPTLDKIYLEHAQNTAARTAREIEASRLLLSIGNTSEDLNTVYFCMTTGQRLSDNPDHEEWRLLYLRWQAMSDGLTPKEVGGSAALIRAVDEFAALMKKKLLAKHNEGFSGWDHSDCYEGMADMLLAHVQRGAGQRVDVANLAMFLHFLEEKTDA